MTNPVSNAPKLAGILETAIYADDLPAAERFYGEILGLERFSSSHPRSVFFRVGRDMLLIFNPAETLKGGEVPAHGARGPGHFAFAVPQGELDAWRAYLPMRGVPIEREITWPNGARSIYFRDPAGNSVELVTPEIWR